MKVLEIKGSLFDLLWGVDDAETLLKIRQFVFETLGRTIEENEDWWDELTPQQQTRLGQALKDVKEGKNIESHEAVLKKIEERFKTPGNGH